jgi:hypothetical protein
MTSDDAPNSAAGPSVRRRPSATTPIVGDSADNDGPPISPLVPSTMHRADVDAEAAATSPEFTERPDGATVDPPARPERSIPDPRKVATPKTD